MLLGIKRPSPKGTATFIGLRSLDPLLQYGILARGVGSGLLSTIGLTQLPAGLATSTGTLLDRLGLSPYRLILLSMAVGTSAKQIFWLTYLSNEEFPPSSAVAVSAYNTFWNSVNDLLFTTTLASASLSSGHAFPQWPLIVGTLAYVSGMSIEVVAELQRKKWKEQNPGKVCNSGLWKYARHINYLGYALVRSGYACAAAGFGFGAFMAAFSLCDFNVRCIPGMDEYCTNRVSRTFLTRNKDMLIISIVWRRLAELQAADALQVDTLCILAWHASLQSAAKTIHYSLLLAIPTF